LDVDFGDDGGNGVSMKTGYAAVGLATNDFWNFYDRSTSPGVWRSSGALVNMPLADGEATTVGMSVSDAPGAWGVASSDPMYQGYIYPFDDGPNVVTFTNLAAGQYDVLAYSVDGNYEVTVDGTSYGVKTTSDPSVSSVPVWTEGVQYARFRNVPVGAGQSLSLIVRDGVGGYAILAGIQILSSGPPVVIPPNISLQPLNQTTVEGSNVVLSVTASGTGPFSYQWNFNGKIISGATNASITLANLHPNQSGDYTVTITTPYGNITSDAASVNVIDQTILIYQYLGSEKTTGGGQTTLITYSGQLFFLPDTTNGVFVGWSTINGRKQYWVNPFSEYLLITVSGAAAQTFTLLAQAGQSYDSNGYPHLIMDLHKGQNIKLSVSSKKSLSFPDTFANTAASIYPSPTTGKIILNESTSTYVYSLKDTKTANDNGQTITDLVNALTKALENQGYNSSNNLSLNTPKASPKASPKLSANEQ